MNTRRRALTSTRHEEVSLTVLERVTNRQPPQQILATHRADTEMTTHRFDAFFHQFGIDETLHLGAESAVSEGEHGHRNPRSRADSSRLRGNSQMAV